jgi:hypothetical protein
MNMTHRHLLRKHLSTAWHTTITNQYCDRLINSERGLQVFFCAALLQQFEKGKVMRRIFVEPHISMVGAPGVLYPDIVICNSKQIIGVVELKYVPRGLPKYSKDLRTLRNIAKADGITLSNDRYCGIERNRFYTLASDAILCWAGVYTGSQLKLKGRIGAGLEQRFLQLDALTVDGKNPTLYPPSVE